MEFSNESQSARVTRHCYVALAILVGLLILNDSVWKAQFGNVITGKLSDFAGVAAVGLFGTLILPRYRFLVISGTAVFFTWWKSPSADPLIEILNVVLPYGVGRTVDWSDLMALASLVPVWWVTRSLPDRRIPIQHGWQYAVIGVSVLSFAATAETLPTEIHFSRRYTFNTTPDSLKALLQAIPDSVKVAHSDGMYATLEIPWTCPRGLIADTRVTGSVSKATLWLDRLYSDCSRDGWNTSELQWLFERKVVHPLIQHVGPATPE